MSAKSNPPSTVSDRVAPLSVLPATEGIDSDWGAEPEAEAAPAAPVQVAPAEPRPAAKAEVPAAKAEVPAAKAEVPAAKAEVPAAKAEVPAAKAEVRPAKAEVPAVRPSAKTPSPAASAPKRTGIVGYVVVGGLLAAAGILWTRRSPDPEPASAPVAVPSPATANTVPASPDPLAIPSAAPVAAAPADSIAPAVGDPAASVVAPAKSASAAPTAAASAQTGDTISVRINITPEGARLTDKGEEVGRTPMTLELPRGEKRVYEVVLKGYYPRRLVVDGTKEEIAYGLKPVETAPPP